MTKQIEMKHFPPKLFLRFFRWFCHPKMQDYIEGDLMEVYEKRLKEFGKRKADIKFIVDVLLLFRPGIIQLFNGKQTELINTSMIRNYIVVAWRNLANNKSFAFINIAGLSVGVTVSVLIMLFVMHELSYDSFHKNEKNIFRLQAEIKYGSQTINASSLSAPFGPLLANSSAGVKNFVRLRQPGRVVVHSDEQHKFFEDKFLFADSSFFSIFSFRILEGSVKTLGTPGKVFITPEVSLKYFGSENAIGKIINYQNDMDLEIVGIVAPPPSNSTLKFDFIASFSTLGLLGNKNESSQYHHDKASLGSYPTYVLLNDRSDAKTLEAIIPKIAHSSVDEKYFLKPFREAPGNFQYLKIFGSVAALVLILALVNYMNLTTARATMRAKEVGVRKIMGASRNALSLQFYLESALITILAFGISCILVSLALPYFQQAVGLAIDARFLLTPLFLSAVIGLLILCILLTGSYPALVLSQLQLMVVIKGRQSGAGSGSWVRKGLTALQFTISVALIISSLTVQQQLDFLRNQKIGMNKEQVLVVNLEGLGSSFSEFRNEVNSLTGVQNVGQASVSLFKNAGMAGWFTKTPKTNEEVFVNVMTVDQNFFNTLGLSWQKQLNDSIKPGDLVINESAIAQLKITEDDLGTKLLLGNETSLITGIVKDFNYVSLKERINPVVMYVNDQSQVPENLGDNGSLYIRLEAKENLIEKVSQIKAIHSKHQSTTPFEYYFLDDAFNNLYQAEDRLALIFKTFTFLAIVIACLGLYGLVTFTTARRTKEIGIRKVLGASVRSILSLVTYEFIWIMIIGIVLAVPLTWWAMNFWLSDFPYRISLSASVFFSGGFVIVVLALATIWTQAVKAAIANPVNSLRSE